MRYLTIEQSYEQTKELMRNLESCQSRIIELKKEQHKAKKLGINQAGLDSIKREIKVYEDHFKSLQDDYTHEREVSIDLANR